MTRDDLSRLFDRMREDGERLLLGEIEARDAEIAALRLKLEVVEAERNFLIGGLGYISKESTDEQSRRGAKRLINEIDPDRYRVRPDGPETAEGGLTGQMPY